MTVYLAVLEVPEWKRREGCRPCVLQSVLQHAAVGECAVVGLEDELKGVVPLALCVLKKGETRGRRVRGCQRLPFERPPVLLQACRRAPRRSPAR